MAWLNSLAQRGGARVQTAQPRGVTIQSKQKKGMSRNKFNAKPQHDMSTGDSFDSTGEMVRYRELQMLERAGEISDLVLHPKIQLEPGIAWKVDYSYTEDGRTVWEDFKPRPPTPKENLLYKLWKIHGPGLLLITGKGGKIIKRIMPVMGAGNGTTNP